MRELTIEQKAKAYDEAIEKLRNFYKDYDTVSRLIDVKEELANLLPELKESKKSEDERIRQEIISAIKEDWPGHTDWIAWLEKQETKEHDVCDTCDEKASCVNPCPVKLVEKLKPTDKVEPKFHEGEWITIKE